MAEDDPEQPPPYSLPEPQAAPAPRSGYGYSQYPPAPAGQASDQPKERSLPGLPGEASTYYQTPLSAQAPAESSQRTQYYNQAPGGSNQLAEGAPSSSSLFGSLSNSFGPGPKRNPLDPPPPAFTRPIAYLDPRPFPPLSLQSHKASLQDGFPALPAAPEGPLPPGAPHPFSTHDIPEADWLRFLEDIAIVARLTGSEKGLPMAMRIALPGGFLISRGIKKMMTPQKSGDVTDLIESWNQFFFQPRHVRAILTRGRSILTTPEGGHSQATIAALSAYGTQHGGGHHDRRRDSSSSDSSSDSSDSSDDDCHRHRHNQGQQYFQGQPMSRRDEKAARRAAKREHREQRREDKRERKAERREQREKRREEKRGRKGERKGGSQEKYRIILIPC